MNSNSQQFTYGLRIAKRSLSDMFLIIREALNNEPNYESLSFSYLQNTKNPGRQVNDIVKLITNNSNYFNNTESFKQNILQYLENEGSNQMALLQCFYNYENSQSQNIFAHIIDNYMDGTYTIPKLLKQLNIDYQVQKNIKKQREIKRALTNLLMLNEIFVFDKSKKVMLNPMLSPVVH